MTPPRWVGLRARAEPGLCSSPPSTEDLAGQAALGDHCPREGPRCGGQQSRLCPAWDPAGCRSLAAGVSSLHRASATPGILTLELCQ